MTPALDLLKKVRAEHRVHSYEHDPKAASYGLEAAEKLGLEPVRVFKTLLASTEKGELLVAVVPVVGTLDLKALAHAAGAKKTEMADPAAAQRSTGYLLEGSVRWVRKSACARSSTKRPHPSRPFLSVRAGEGWKWSFRRRCWRLTPARPSPPSVVSESTTQSLTACVATLPGAANSTR